MKGKNSLDLAPERSVRNELILVHFSASTKLARRPNKHLSKNAYTWQSESGGGTLVC